MPFDAFFLSAVTQELGTLTGSRIERVQQPARDTVLLSLRGAVSGHKKLLFALNPAHPRVQFTELSFENPAQPPMFCMLLRKHLTGARVLSVEQLPRERMLTFTLEAYDEFGELSRKYLFLELIGRSANLILADAERRIIDCLRRVDLEMSEERQILPGLFYREPAPQQKLDPCTMSSADFLELLENANGSLRLDKLLLQSLAGVSPLLCREASWRITGAVDTPVDRLPDLSDAAAGLAAFFPELEKPVPTMLLDGSTPKDFSCIPIGQYENALTAASCESCSELLDAFYGRRERSERQRQRAQTLTKAVTTQRDRLQRKLGLQQQELASSLDREQLRRCGDMIMANLYQIRKGQTEFTAEDFYDPELRPVTIRLQAHLSPQQNAAKYYKDYSKAKNAERILKEQIARGEQELLYLNSVLDELARAESERDLTEIRTELVQQGYVRDTDRKKQMKQQPAKPMEFESSTGWPILVGRNNRQNDQLTLKTAEKRDIWLHTQKIHGSHVVILCGSTTPDDATMTEAAMLAAWYSQARGSQNIPVDTTAVKNVRKPAGALPGMVIYDHYRTLYVTPDETLPEKLMKKEGAK